MEVCIGAILLLYRTHRKLYDLKMKNGWIGSNGSKIMTADSAGDARTVDVHIRRLREKIEMNPSEPKYVHTKWGVGYYFQD